VPVLQIPEELTDLRSSLRRFVDREIAPVEDSFAREIQEGRYEPLKDERTKIRRRSAELGFWGLHMPEDVGGMDLSLLGQVLLFEEATSRGLILAHNESIFPVVTGPSRVHLDCTEAQRQK
jgi:alkylation response protein AidB-like acyl-CoA dehydrogenase